MSGPRIQTERLRQVAVLFEDDHLLAIGKPSGIAVHGGAAEKKRTVLEVLGGAYEGGASGLFLVHRLDRGTSGALLLAKTQELAQRVRARWHEAEKIYWAVALGRIAGPMRVDQPLDDKDGRVLDAITHFQPLAEMSDVEPVTTLVEASLETGRTHQIRRHLAARNHPVLMDDKHGQFAANKAWDKAVRAAGGPRPKHLMLHARQLQVNHPVTGRRLYLEAPLPEAWTKILATAGAKLDETRPVS